MEVVENKNAGEKDDNNDLTDGEKPEESVPLKESGEARKEAPPKPKRPASFLAALKSGRSGRKMSDMDAEDPDDPGPSVSDTSDNEQDGKKRRGRGGKDVLGLWAHRCRLTPKRGLIYLLFCGSLIVLLLLLLLLLAALWPRGQQHESCSLPQCHKFSERVLGAVNSSVHPCHAFWDHSCGGWLQANPLPKSQAYWDVEAQHELAVKDKIRTLLSTLNVLEMERKEPNSVILKMQRFYDGCMSVHYIESDEAKGLLRIIKGLGGWSLLRDFKPNDFDFPRLLRKVHSEFDIHPFFRVSVIADPHASTRNVIQVSPSGLSLPHPSYYFDQSGPMATAFHTFAKDVAQLLGATSFQGKSFADEMFYFEKRLAEITPDPLNYSDPVVNLKRYTVGELKSMSNTIFWGDFLQALFPHGVINDMTPVVTPSIQYLTEVSGVISTTDKGNLNNYIMWHLAQKFLPYLSQPFTSALQMFRRDSLGAVESPPRWEFCISETIKFFPHGMDLLLARSRHESLGTSADPRVGKVKELFQSIKDAFANEISTDIMKYEDPLRNFLLDKLRLMTIQVGSAIHNSSYTQEFYYSVQVQKSELFPNVISLIEFQWKLRQKDLAIPSRESTIMMTTAARPFTIQYIPALNKVVVPQSVLEKDELNVPNELTAILYGTIGVEIGEAIAQAFGPVKGFYLSNGALLSNRDSKVATLREIIDSRRTCLSSFFTNIRLDDEDYIERTSLDTALHLAGLQMTLRALQDLEYKGESLPGMDLSPEEVFFMAYGQSQCSTHTIQFHDMEHTMFSELSHEHKVRGVLRQFVPFSEAFQCSKNAEMYADFTCGSVL